MKLISIYLDKPGGYFKKEKYRHNIIEEQLFSLKTKDRQEANSFIKELKKAAKREIFGVFYDEEWGGIYFEGRTKYDVMDYSNDKETKFFFDFFAITSPFENPGKPLSIEFYNTLCDLFYDPDMQYRNEHTLFFVFDNNQEIGKVFSLNYIHEDNLKEVEIDWYSEYFEPDYSDDYE